MLPGTGVFSTLLQGVLEGLADGPGQVNVVIPAPAYGASRQLAGPHLGMAEGAEALQVDEGPAVRLHALDRQDPARVPVDVEDVIGGTAVFVGLLRRAPPAREGEPAVTADEVPEVRHPSRMPPAAKFSYIL
jgi:hypothetical protein